MRTAAPAYELVIPQGSTFRRTFRWLDAAGVPIDLTGYVARLGARLAYESEDYLFLVESDDGYGPDGTLVLGGALGTIALLMPPEVTAALDYEEAVWDLEVESPLGVVTRLAQGVTRLDREVVR